ncbi:hypothetical protein [Phaeacidiphilus oryzae]|uniref:hypothetical protein n=1 Tax=Phaeacidiphilus oryzae TaxID=348818 RepID=UPI00055FFBCD|nr:hypothetical protein [Phaeacidiphilus oryzae]
MDKNQGPGPGEPQDAHGSHDSGEAGERGRRRSEYIRRLLRELDGYEDTAGGEIRAELHELDRLRQTGEITQEEWERHRAEIIRQSED